MNKYNKIDNNKDSVAEEILLWHGSDNIGQSLVVIKFDI